VDWRTASPGAFKPGQVLETNSFVLGSLVDTCGGTFTRHPMVADDPSIIKAAMERALSDDVDLVMIIGGSSAGSEDYARAVLDSLGEVLVHGVTIMPGKPAVIGSARGVPVFGIPGYPVSAIIVFEQLVRPLLTACWDAGGTPKPPRWSPPARWLRSWGSRNSSVSSSER
jgi:putative molybdopterin biosynthesis protein